MRNPGRSISTTAGSTAPRGAMRSHQVCTCRTCTSPSSSLGPKSARPRWPSLTSDKNVAARLAPFPYDGEDLAAVRAAADALVGSGGRLDAVFLNAGTMDTTRVMWLTIVHMAFVISALLLAYIDRVMAMTKKEKDGHE